MTPMTKEALAEYRKWLLHANKFNNPSITILKTDFEALLDELEDKDKRIAEQSMLLEGSDAILADYAETLSCAGDTDSILAAIVALQSRAESAEQALKRSLLVICCWSCETNVVAGQVMNLDGHCPACGEPIDLDDEPYARVITLQKGGE